MLRNSASAGSEIWDFQETNQQFLSALGLTCFAHGLAWWNICGMQEVDAGHVPSKEAALCCYNQSRDFCCWIARHQNDSEKLAKLIVDKGLSDGTKAYFKAFVDQSSKQLVVLPAMLPAQAW